MNIKLISLLSIFVVFLTCKKDQENTEVVVEKPIESLEITAKDVSKIRYTDYILDERTENAIINWNEYKQLANVIHNVKKGNFSFFSNNEKETNDLLRNLKQNIPLEVNSNAITARIIAFETKLLKLQSLYNLSTTSKQELIGLTKEFLVAFSNLNLQMNKKLEADSIIIEKP